MSAPVEAIVQEEALDEHEQAMTDLVDETAAKAIGDANPEDAPEYVAPEEPVDIDYKAEYEKMLSEKEVPVPEEKPSEEVIPEAADADLITPDALDKYTKEFTTDGNISQASYDELKAQGYSKAIVDNYIQGQAAIGQAQNQRVFAKAGGPEAYNDMLTWAKDTWSPEQITVFNDQVNSGNEQQMMFGVDALKAQHAAATAGLPTRALKGSGGQGGGEESRGYADKSLMYKDMENRLYGKDASYTNMVTKKIGLSQF